MAVLGCEATELGAESMSHDASRCAVSQIMKPQGTRGLDAGEAWLVVSAYFLLLQAPWSVQTTVEASER